MCKGRSALCCGPCVKALQWISTCPRWGGESASKKNQSLFNRGLNYANPIIVINCWENSALIAPKQQAQLYTALMWILGNQLVHFHMKELILCLEGELEEVTLLFWLKPLCVCLTNLQPFNNDFLLFLSFSDKVTMFQIKPAAEKPSHEIPKQSEIF